MKWLTAGAVLNAQIFETIYHAALEASCELAKKDGPYSSYEGSPASKGILQQDLWEKQAKDNNKNRAFQTVNDWDKLRAKIKSDGLRNSLLVAPMPTASTSQILGVNECIEPYTSNMYVRRVKSGEFILTNSHLLQDLTDLGLWNDR